MSRVPISEDEAQRIMAQQQQHEDRASAASEQREAMLRAFVTAEGRERLKRVEQVREDRARTIEMHIIQQVRAGKLQPPIGDDIVRELLSQLSTEGGVGGSSGPKITVVRKRGDDDW
eukprot:GILI01014647.1.p1 GENE.GILI01014647.1~~GILI01014647.1.p1  ORF type:complete len:117 (-),score=41.92 GILI01014647.1:101-451(-)